MYLFSLLASTSSYTPNAWECVENKAVNAFDASLASKKADMSFDTDSFEMKIDNCCTRSMSHCIRDFLVGSMKPVRNSTVKGYGGSNTSITHQGIISWTIQDDNGSAQTLLIPNLFYVPLSTIRLLSPQHMAQQMNDHFPTRRGTWCATYDDAISLQWDQRRHTKTVKLDPKSSNVGTIWSVPGYQAHDHFCSNMAKLDDNWDNTPQCYEVNLDESKMDEVNGEHVEHKGSVTEYGEKQLVSGSQQFELMDQQPRKNRRS
jgi:hypothetical protein